MEVLQDFPSATPTLEWLLQAAPRLKPRLFSIASSQALLPGHAHLTGQRWRACPGLEQVSGGMHARGHATALGSSFS